MTRPVFASSDGSEWLVVPTDVAASAPAEQLAWGKRTASGLLPKRMFLQQKGLMQLQTMLGSLASVTRPGEQYAVLVPELPDEFVIIRLRWSTPSDPEAVRALAGPDAQDGITTAEAVVVPGPGGVEAYRAEIVGGSAPAAGFVTSFPVGDVAAQVRFSVPPALLARTLPSAERFVAAVRIEPGR
jgi:hypothetical protein